jgi:branched-chain amino acid transport system substrate-binding protein
VYDAVMVTLLAMESADEINGTSIRDNVRKVTAADGTPVYPGPEDLKQAKQLIAEGKSIRYVGATGPLQFDQWGDVSAPKMTWRYTEDGTEEIGYYSLEDVDALIKRLDN